MTRTIKLPNINYFYTKSKSTNPYARFYNWGYNKAATKLEKTLYTLVNEGGSEVIQISNFTLNPKDCVKLRKIMIKYLTQVLKCSKFKAEREISYIDLDIGPTTDQDVPEGYLIIKGNLTRSKN